MNNSHDKNNPSASNGRKKEDLSPHKAFKSHQTAKDKSETDDRYFSKLPESLKQFFILVNQATEQSLSSSFSPTIASSYLPKLVDADETLLPPEILEEWASIEHHEPIKPHDIKSRFESILDEMPKLKTEKKIEILRYLSRHKLIFSIFENQDIELILRFFNHLQNLSRNDQIDVLKNLYTHLPPFQSVHTALGAQKSEALTDKQIIILKIILTHTFDLNHKILTKVLIQAIPKKIFEALKDKLALEASDQSIILSAKITYLIFSTEEMDPSLHKEDHTGAYLPTEIEYFIPLIEILESSTGHSANTLSDGENIWNEILMRSFDIFSIQNQKSFLESNPFRQLRQRNISQALLQFPHAEEHEFVKIMSFHSKPITSTLKQSKTRATLHLPQDKKAFLHFFKNLNSMIQIQVLESYIEILGADLVPIIENFSKTEQIYLFTQITQKSNFIKTLLKNPKNRDFINFKELDKILNQFDDDIQDEAFALIGKDLSIPHELEKSVERSKLRQNKAPSYPDYFSETESDALRSVFALLSQNPKINHWATKIQTDPRSLLEEASHEKLCIFKIWLKTLILSDHETQLSYLSSDHLNRLLPKLDAEKWTVLVKTLCQIYQSNPSIISQNLMITILNTCKMQITPESWVFILPNLPIEDFHIKLTTAHPNPTDLSTKEELRWFLLENLVDADLSQVISTLSQNYHFAPKLKMIKNSHELADESSIQPEETEIATWQAEVFAATRLGSNLQAILSKLQTRNFENSDLLAIFSEKICRAVETQLNRCLSREYLELIIWIPQIIRPSIIIATSKNQKPNNPFEKKLIDFLYLEAVDQAEMGRIIEELYQKSDEFIISSRFIDELKLGHYQPPHGFTKKEIFNALNESNFLAEILKLPHPQFITDRVINLIKRLYPKQQSILLGSEAENSLSSVPKWVLPHGLHLEPLKDSILKQRKTLIDYLDSNESEENKKHELLSYLHAAQSYCYNSTESSQQREEICESFDALKQSLLNHAYQLGILEIFLDNTLHPLFKSVLLMEKSERSRKFLTAFFQKETTISDNFMMKHIFQLENQMIKKFIHELKSQILDIDLAATQAIEPNPRTQKFIFILRLYLFIDLNETKNAIKFNLDSLEENIRRLIHLLLKDNWNLADEKEWSVIIKDQINILNREAKKPLGLFPEHQDLEKAEFTHQLGQIFTSIDCYPQPNPNLNI